MNAYFGIVLISFVLFFAVWGLGWLLERLSYRILKATQSPGSRPWYALVGPGVALHESSHALGCVLTRTEIVEFKPINVSVQDDQIVLGYVKYRKPPSALKNAVINLAPVAVSLLLLVAFAFGATYLVPDRPSLGRSALDLFWDLVNSKSMPLTYPFIQIGAYVYDFLYTISQLTVINPVFWIVAFLAMTIMFSNAPSEADIRNAATGLKFIVAFNLIWLGVAFFLPDAGWLLVGLFEILAVMFSLALAFAAVGYGFFILVAAMARIKAPLQIVPFLVCICTGVLMALYGVGTPAFQTIVALGAFMLTTLMMLSSRPLRAA
jgi:hypothetical protein